MKTYNIFGEVNAQNSLKNKIMNEIQRRYAFEKLGKSYKNDNEDYKPTFPFFMFKHQEKPTIHELFDHLFGGYRITNPLAYAKKLAEEANPKKNIYPIDELEQLHLLAENIRKHKCDDYDFEIDGVPVKIYQKFIQVGYDIIPLENYNGFFDSIKDEEKKETILNIIININNNITHIAA